jgi:hypothetical protein
MSMAPENATSWRDLADELTPEQVEDLEDYDRKTNEFVAALIGPPPFDPREAVLRIARRYATENMMDALIGDVPTPAGADFVDTWQEGEPQPYRVILGPRRVVGKVEIQRSVTQFADGSIDQVGLIAAPGIRVRANREDGLTKKQARELAALLLEAADEMDGWTR